MVTNAGIGGKNFNLVIDQCKDFRELVTALYDNQEIKKKIQTDLSQLLGRSDFKKVFVASHLIKWIGENVDPMFLRAVTGCDAYAVIAKFKETAGEYFAIGEEKIEARSAIFSEYLIQKHLGSSDIIDSLFFIIVEATKRKKDRKYQTILSALFRQRIFEDALKEDPKRDSKLISLFERLRREDDVNQEPLFWLQYSILMSTMNELNTAERFLETAYERAEAGGNFLTYQIDTYALGLLLQIETKLKENENIVRFEKIINLLERIRPMIGNISHRGYAIKVLEGLNPFVEVRLQNLSDSQKSTLTAHLDLLIDNLNKLPFEERATTGAERIKASIVQAKTKLTT